jgi:hypothetical protein
MALEKAWGLVPPQLFTSDGTQFGEITVANTAGFKVKQTAYLKATGLPDLPVQIKRVLSSTLLVVGTVNNAQIAQWPPLNVTAYTVARNAAIGAQIQPKSNPTVDDIMKAVYETDPTVALRVIFTDQYGNLYSDENPLPATFSGSISIGAVEVKGTNGNYIEPNPDGSINVVVESTPSSNQVVNTYSQLMVAGGATMQLISYTVPNGDTGILQRGSVSGENIGRYDILINGVIQDTVRTMFGGDLTQMFDFTDGIGFGLPLNAGDIVAIQVNNPRSYSGNYNGRIQVMLIT